MAKLMDVANGLQQHSEQTRLLRAESPDAKAAVLEASRVQQVLLAMASALQAHPQQVHCGCRARVDVA